MKKMSRDSFPWEITGVCEAVVEQSNENLLNESLDVLIDNYLVLGDDSFGMMLMANLRRQQ
jgi:hypothetical protein